MEINFKIEIFIISLNTLNYYLTVILINSHITNFTPHIHYILCARHSLDHPCVLLYIRIINISRTKNSLTKRRNILPPLKKTTIKACRNFNRVQLLRKRKHTSTSPRYRRRRSSISRETSPNEGP